MGNLQKLTHKPTFQDYLEWYKNRDIGPMVEAITQQKGLLCSERHQHPQGRHQHPQTHHEEPFPGAGEYRHIFFTDRGSQQRPAHMQQLQGQYCGWAITGLSSIPQCGARTTATLPMQWLMGVCVS